MKTLFLGNPDYKNRSSITKPELKSWVRENLILWKPRVENVIPYLQRSKISILPSYREGLPKGLLEAASCSLPIISTNVPGCREVCKNNYNGFLIRTNDPKSLSESIKKLIFNKKLLKRFGLNSRSLVKKKFSSDIISKKFLDVYIEIIKKVP